MKEELQKYEATIEKKHSFGWTPTYKEEFITELNQTVFFPISKEVIELLGWELIFENESSIEARHPAEGFHWGHNLIINYESGKITAQSKSIGTGFWDVGRNSKLVKLFVYAFKKVEEKYDEDALIALEEKVVAANNWEDYEIPETLPPPRKQAPSKLWIPILGGIFLSIISGFLIAFLTVNFIYVIGLYEIGIAFLIGFGFKYLIPVSYTHLTLPTIYSV